MIRDRIEVYRGEDAAAVDYYQGRYILPRVDASGTIDEVKAGINSALDRSFRHRDAEITRRRRRAE